MVLKGYFTLKLIFDMF